MSLVLGFEGAMCDNNRLRLTRDAGCRTAYE
jgi:hypothetical protein